jgi:hypothetical protein
MKLGAPALALAAAATVFGMSVAVAQTTPPAQAPFAQPPFKNLKVFPQDITRPQLLSNMRLFSQSLGVRCTFCHVGVEGQPLSTIDFASDAKEKKLRAREMLRMAHRINTEEFDGEMRVTCFTCHRGSTKPARLPPAPPAATPAKPERGSA